MAEPGPASPAALETLTLGAHALKTYKILFKISQYNEQKSVHNVH